MTPDKICKHYSDAAVALSIKLIDANPGRGGDDVPMVLVEGSAQALTFLSEVLAAVAKGQAASTFTLSPAGPGSSHFLEGATHGIYVRRI